MIAGVIPEFRWGADFAQAWRPAYPVDAVRYFDRPRVVERTVTLAGVEDAWIAGTDYLVAGRVRWMGRGQFASDAGFAGLVRAARDGAVRCYPDPVTAPDWFVPCYVENVDAIAPEPEPDLTMSAEVTLRGASGATVSPVWLTLAPANTTGVTLTRSGDGRFYDHSAGLLRTAGTNGLRTSWRRTNAGRWESGLLIEGNSTNRLLRSEDATTTWFLDGVTVTANAGTAPDGTVTMDRLAETATTGPHRIIQTYTGTANTVQLLSAYVRRVNGRDWAILVLDGGTDANRLQVSFNLATGTVGTATTEGTGSGPRGWMEPTADGAWRLYLAGSPATGTTTYRASVGLASADNTISYTGATANTALVWGMQAQDNEGFIGSYIPTTTAAASRNGDVFSRTLVGTAVAAPRVLTAYHRGILTNPWPYFPASGYPMVLGDGGGTANVGLGKTGAAAVGAFAQAGGAVVFANVTIADPVVGDVIELMATLLPSGVVVATVSVNGGTPATGTSAVPTFNLLNRAWGDQALRTIGGPFPWLATHTLVLAGTRTLAECRAFAGVSA